MGLDTLQGCREKNKLKLWPAMPGNRYPRKDLSMKTQAEEVLQ